MKVSMTKNRANCNFCSLPDNSVQVICDSRCLICSRCQLMPIVRKLLLDHSEFCINSSGPNPFYTSFAANTDAAGLTITSPMSPSGSPAVSSRPVSNGVVSNNFNTVGKAISGTCPICAAAFSAGMLLLVQTFKESWNLQQPDEDTGKIPTEILLEENTFLISNFLRRYKVTYEDVVSKVTEHDIIQRKLEQLKGARINPQGATLQDIHSGTVKLGLTGVLEFVLECYSAQWQSMLRYGNETMLTIMIKQAFKKKFSNKTNDFRTKSLIDFFLSNASIETTESLLFGYLIGLQPKPSNRISTGWGQIATAILVSAHCERCLKTNSLNDHAGNPTVSDFRTKLAKTLLGHSSKMLSLKKAIKIISLLCYARQPYWIMAPLSSACVEHQGQLPWSASSMSKILNIMFYVSLYEFNADPSNAPVSRLHPEPISGGNMNTQGVKSTGNSRRILSRGSTLASIDNSSSNFQKSSKPYSRVDMMRNIDAVIHKVWSSTSKKAYNSNEETQALIFKHICDLDIEKVEYYSFTTDDALQLCGNLSLSVFELALLAVRCWEVEYSLVLSSLNQAECTSQRRLAIVGHYDTSGAVMSLVEKQCLMKLLHWYSLENEFRGIDWDEVEQSIEEGIFPFTIPETLLDKTRNELQYLAEMVTKELIEIQLRDKKDDEEAKKMFIFDNTDFAYEFLTQSESAASIVDPKYMENYANEVAVSEGNKFSQGQLPLIRPSSAAQKASSRPTSAARPIPAELASPDNKARPVSAKAQSFPKLEEDVPLVDIIDIDDEVLIRSKTTSRPVSGKARPEHESGLSSLHLEDDIADFHLPEMKRTGSKLDKAPKHDVRIEKSFHEDHFVNKVFVDDENVAQRKKLDVRGFEDSREGIVAKYKEALEAQRISKFSHARQRVLDRIDHSSSSTSTLITTGDRGKTIGVASSSSPTQVTRKSLKKVDIIENKTQSIESSKPKNQDASRSFRSFDGFKLFALPFLDLSESVTLTGDLVLSISISLCAQSPILYLRLKCTQLHTKGLVEMMKTFCSPNQLKDIRVLDLSGNSRLGCPGSKIISKALSSRCNLIHINLNHMKIGDFGVRHLLQGILNGRGENHLLRLDLQDNDITLATDSLTLLEKFAHLKALDLSRNNFSLDTSKQFSYFEMAVKNLSKLRLLSLAYNKIQDSGFNRVLDLMLFNNPLLVLDVAGCFITNKSMDMFRTLLAKWPKKPRGLEDDDDDTLPLFEPPLDAAGDVTDSDDKFLLRRVLIQENLISQNLWEEIAVEKMSVSNCKLLLHERYEGIGNIPVYVPEEYGIRVAPGIL